MATPRHQSPEAEVQVIADHAAKWLARRDRGLTAAEQDEYIQWLTADPRHAEALTRHAAAFERMMKLYEWQPGQSSEPNPDLFAPPQKPRWRVLSFAALAAAAALTISTGIWWHGSTSQPGTIAAHTTHLRVNERQALADGSVVELKDGSRILVEFSDVERRVRLFGEAHFNIVKDPKPFLVLAGPVAVKAIGTSFNVRADPDKVEVLVTGGVVSVDKIAEPADGLATTSADPSAAASAAPEPARLINAGQRAVVPLGANVEPHISDVTPHEMRETLGWQAPRLQFFETPLALAVEEFNQRNRIRIVLASRDLASIPVGGTFRVDNPEGFVRVLRLTLNIKAEPRGPDEIVLSREQ
jgi:transmembrane sensor